MSNHMTAIGRHRRRNVQIDCCQSIHTSFIERQLTARIGDREIVPPIEIEVHKAEALTQEIGVPINSGSGSSSDHWATPGEEDPRRNTMTRTTGTRNINTQCMASRIYIR